jgi:hypothetical protein
MQATKPFILYNLPKSRTTQAFLYGNKIAKIWESLEHFFENCTTTSINRPSKIELTAYSAVSEDQQPELAVKFASKLKEFFGEGKIHKSGEAFATETIWKLTAEELPKIIDYLIQGQPWPKFTFGPVELFLIYDFYLIHPDNRKELENQEIASSILIWLSKRCSCSSDLWLPFEDANSEFYNYINKLEFFLPFKLEYKYFKKGRPNKAGTNHIFNCLFK